MSKFCVAIVISIAISIQVLRWSTPIHTTVNSSSCDSCLWSHDHATKFLVNPVTTTKIPFFCRNMRSHIQHTILQAQCLGFLEWPPVKCWTLWLKLQVKFRAPWWLATFTSQLRTLAHRLLQITITTVALRDSNYRSAWAQAQVSSPASVRSEFQINRN